MIKLLGLLTGSTIAVGILIVVIGIPEFPDRPETVELPPAHVEAPEPVAVATPEPVAEPIPEPLEEPGSQQMPEPVADPALEPLPEPLPAPAPEQDEATQWYAFWSPFRSELAASGFVAQLQRTTGLDYRVVKQKAGVYEVAFAYVDDADIETKLEKISSATGLDIPEG